MTDQPIDPAATPDADDAPEIAADDAGASAIAERIGRHAETSDGEGEDSDAAEEEEGLDGEGV